MVGQVNPLIGILVADNGWCGFDKNSAHEEGEKASVFWPGGGENIAGGVLTKMLLVLKNQEQTVAEVAGERAAIFINQKVQIACEADPIIASFCSCDLINNEFTSISIWILQPFRKSSWSACRKYIIWPIMVSRELESSRPAVNLRTIKPKFSWNQNIIMFRLETPQRNI